MCLVEFIVKYVLIIVNFAFAFLGVVVAGLGIATVVIAKDINDILPVQTLGISMIILGAVVFLIAFLACCGAIRESQCMLVSYAIVVAVLTGLTIWLSIVIFSALSNMGSIVEGWLTSAFDRTPAFHILESSFQCCGTTGPDAYGTNPLPMSCCDPLWQLSQTTSATNCTVDAAFPIGCNLRVANWFSTFGGAVGGVILTVVVVELVAVLFSLFFCNAVRDKRRQNY